MLGHLGLLQRTAQSFPQFPAFSQLLTVDQRVPSIAKPMDAFPTMLRAIRRGDLEDEMREEYVERLRRCVRSGGLWLLSST